MIVSERCVPHFDVGLHEDIVLRSLAGYFCADRGENDQTSSHRIEF